MKHKILCTIKSAIYYAGFKRSFLNGQILTSLLATGGDLICPLCELCSTDRLLRSQRQEQGRSENRIPIGCCVINTVCYDHLVIVLRGHSDWFAVKFPQSMF